MRDASYENTTPAQQTLLLRFEPPALAWGDYPLDCLVVTDLIINPDVPLANVALPSFIGHGIAFTILLPLVAAIEAGVLSKMLGISFKEAFSTAASANWRSTLSGLPAGWLMALAGLIPAGILVAFLPKEYQYPGIQIIAFTALTGGIIPDRFTLVAIPIANLLILVPYYFATVRVEQRVVEVRHPEIDSSRVSSAVRKMNRVSYISLALLILWWLATGVVNYLKVV